MPATADAPASNPVSALLSGAGSASSSTSPPAGSPASPTRDTAASPTDGEGLTDAERAFWGEDGAEGGETATTTTVEQGETSRATGEGDATDAASPPAPAKAQQTDSDDFRKAYAALIRDGVPRETLDAMMDHPDRLLAWGQSAAKRQADVDRTFAELKKAAETAGKAPEAPKGETPPAGAQPGTDLAALLEPVAAALGDDVRDPLGKAFSAVLQEAQSRTLQSLTPQIEQVEALSTALARLGGLLERSWTKAARAELREKFPELEDDANFESVKAEMKALAGTREFGDVTELMDFAARVLWADKLAERHRAQMAKQATAKARGTPTVESRQAPPKAMSTDDIGDMGFDLAAKVAAGEMTVAEAKRRLQSQTDA